MSTYLCVGVGGSGMCMCMSVKPLVHTFCFVHFFFIAKLGSYVVYLCLMTWKYQCGCMLRSVD